MEKQQKILVGFVAGTLLVAGGLGALIYMKKGDNEDARQGVTDLEAKITNARKTIEGTAGLEQEVIVLREVATVIDQILPNSEDLNGLNEDFHEYATQSQVRATAVKLKPDRGNARGVKLDFEKVGYTLNLEGGIFQFLEFLNRIETHSRFLAVPSFKVSSSTRQQIDRYGEARHSIQVDVETYTYASNAAVQPVRIEGYSRKRDLLSAEINRRRKALTVGRFEYRGERGRRDPWIDPRVPLMGDGNGWPVPDQITKVEELSAMTAECMQQWLAVEGAKNVLDRLVQKDELESMLGALDEELRRVEGEGAITYVPAQKRLEIEVYEPRALLREKMDQTSDLGLTLAQLESIADQMTNHVNLGEYDFALIAFNQVEPQLELVAGDPMRSTVAQDIRDLALEAETLRDFEAIELEVGGSIFIGDNPPAIIINGRSLTIGDEVVPGLEIAAIHENEVDFYFRGFVLSRVH